MLLKRRLLYWETLVILKKQQKEVLFYNEGDFGMAKPIRATPTLIGEEAIRFLDKMRRTDSENRLSPSDKILVELMHKNEKLFRV